MTADGAGVTFRETMSGGFALGETAPAAGERAGRTAGTQLVLRASLLIPRVKDFVADAAHRGMLDGSVSFGPLGTDLRASSGFFQLFTATDDPALKLMQYRMTFCRGAETYCLDGAKHVRRGSPLRGWSDTTTLSCRLHSGADESGPVVGAGILRLTPASFARQLISFRSVNGGTTGTQVGALVAFFNFFARELLDSYL